MLKRIDPTFRKAMAALRRTASLEEMVDAYLIAALWAETDADGNPLEKTFDVSDFSSKARGQAEAECAEFLLKAGDAIQDLNNDSQVGHDFWLTRNGHGVGFWDRENIYGPDMAQFLTAVAKDFPEIGVYGGTDGKLYFQ